MSVPNCSLHESSDTIRGAYCAMVMIALLRLPLKLPEGSPGRSQDEDTFLKGLPEYLSRCMFGLCMSGQTFD